MALVLWLFQSRRPSAPTPKSKYFFNHVCPVHVVYHHHCTTNSNPLFTITTLPPISLSYYTTASVSISVSSNPTFSPFHFITSTTQTSVTTKPTATSIRAPRAGEYLGSNNINHHPHSGHLQSSTQPASDRTSDSNPSHSTSSSGGKA